MHFVHSTVSSFFAWALVWVHTHVYDTLCSSPALMRPTTRNPIKSLRVHLEFLGRLFLKLIYLLHTQPEDAQKRNFDIIEHRFFLYRLKCCFSHTFPSSSLVGMLEIGNDKWTALRFNENISSLFSFISKSQKGSLRTASKNKTENLDERSLFMPVTEHWGVLYRLIHWASSPGKNLWNFSLEFSPKKVLVKK